MKNLLQIHNWQMSFFFFVRMMAIHPGLSKMTCPDAPIRVTSACLHIVNVPIRHTSPDIRYPSVREVNETPLYPSSHTNLDKYGCLVKNHIKENGIHRGITWSCIQVPPLQHVICIKVWNLRDMRAMVMIPQSRRNFNKYSRSCHRIFQKSS